MQLPDYKLVGQPRRQRSRGQLSAVYVQRYRLLDDPPRKLRVVSLKTEDKTTARRIAARTVEDALRKVIDAAIAPKASPHILTPLLTHLDDYIADLKADGRSPNHIVQVRSRCRRLFKTCQFKWLSDLDAIRIKAWLAAKREKGEFAMQTTCLFVGSVRAFSRWCLKHGRITADPLINLPRKPKGDVLPTFRRRAFTPEELNRLLANARKSDKRLHGLAGEQRMYLYLAASATGFRTRELSTICPSNCHLDADPPIIEIACTISKRRKHDRQEISPEVARLLRPFVEGKPRNARLWPGYWRQRSCEMLREDLTGIDETTEEGVLQFHSLRHTMVTNTVSTGANQNLVMEICRLSSPELIKRYYHSTSEQRSAVVAALPVPKVPM